MTTDPTRRFSSRVDNYVKYRPGYPAAVLDVLRDECGLRTDSVVADIGSGTGIFSDLLLRHGCRVIGVEPNDDMRAAGERFLAGHARFSSVKGTAEATTLAAGSVDLITAAQAFHWFDREPTRAEFARIVKPGGSLALIWNERQLASTSFLSEYENLLLVFGTDYVTIRQRDLDLAQVQAFVGASPVKRHVVANVQQVDFDGARGRLLSSSYVPEAGHPNYAPMLAELRLVFDRYQKDGVVEFCYDTTIFTASLA